jgi:pSer/pThr/pTyr-binding forkhead associated (FHA) protein
LRASPERGGESTDVTTPILQIVGGPELGRKHALTEDRMVMGRHPDCDIVLDSAAVSRGCLEQVYVCGGIPTHQPVFRLGAG